MHPRLRVLCVDDEPNVLEGLSLHLRRRYDVITAVGGPAALDAFRKDRPPAIVISDMRMPVMNGAALLAKVRELSPDTVRILLTGQTDLDAAIAAVNEGQIFRFLSKPCPPPSLLAAVDAAAEQYRLITSERVLLEQTLQGSIKMLVDLLSLTHPAVFGRAMRVKHLVTELADKIGLNERWPAEVAAMLSQLGWVTLPPELAQKAYEDQPLSDDEKAMVARMPLVTEQLLGNIPRLEVVRGILARQQRAGRLENEYTGQQRQLIFHGAQLLRVATDFDALESRGTSAATAISALRDRGGYDPGLLDAVAALRGAEVPRTPDHGRVGDAPRAPETRAEGRTADTRTIDAPRDEVRELPLKALCVGMILAEDLKADTGTLLVARGDIITQSFIERSQHLRPGTVREPVRVLVRARRRAS